MGWCDPAQNVEVWLRRFKITHWITGKIEESKRVLTYLRPTAVEAEKELKEYETLHSKNTKNWLEVVRERSFLKPLLITVVLGALGQLNGFNIVLMYLETILDMSNTSLKSDTASAIIGLTLCLASFCTSVITDRFGRKIVLVVTFAGIGVGMVSNLPFFCNNIMPSFSFQV